MTTCVLGIDVSKATLDVALIDHKCKTNTQVANTGDGYRQLDTWVRKQGYMHAGVCLEATGQYSDGIAEYLHHQGYAVSVVNPARIKHYANSRLRRNKTDKADAQLIAWYGLVEKPATWTPPSAIFKDLQALVRHLDDLMGIRQQLSNRLSCGVKTATVIDNLNEIVAFLNKQIQQTRQDIQTHINNDPELLRRQELLTTIPGIGKLTAAKLLGEIRDILEFDNARQLAAYAGLTPRNIFSGSSVHKKTRLSKTGNANLRKLLYMPALSAKRWNPIIAEFCARLSQNGLRPKEVLGAAMRKLLHICFGVIKSGRPFDPNYVAII